MQQQHSARSRPWDKGGGGVHAVIQTLRKGGPGLQKNFFSPWSKNKGGGEPSPQVPPLNLPLQQQVYSVLLSLYMVLPTEIQ